MPPSQSPDPGLVLCRRPPALTVLTVCTYIPTYMYIKPALPCLPSRGVEHTFLSRPGRGWGEATARGLPASRCGVHTGDRVHVPPPQAGASAVPSFSAEGAGPSGGRTGCRGGRKPTGRGAACTPSPAQPSPAQPSPLATAADTCLNTDTWSTPQFCLKGPPRDAPALSASPSRTERHL